MATSRRQIRLSDEVFEAIERLPGKTQNDKLQGLLFAGQALPTSSENQALLECLELVRSLPDLPAIRQMLMDVIKESRVDRARELAGKIPSAPTPESKYTRQDGKAMTYWERYEVDKAEELERRSQADKTASATGRRDIDYTEQQ